jgi:hypothetical protein
MGIINNDSHESHHGIQLSNTYIRIKTLETFKVSGVIKMGVVYQIYNTEASKDIKTPLDEIQIVIDVTLDGGNYYTQAYTHLKTIYTNYTDVL